MDGSQSTSKKSKSRSRRSRRSKRDPPIVPITELEPIPEQPILLLKSEADAEKDRGSPRGWNITQAIVPRVSFTPTEIDLHDGIVFVFGHSQFKGRMCHRPTRIGMKQRTLLVANIGNTCFWFSKPELVEAFIRERFSEALSYGPTNVERFIHTAKSELRKMPKTTEKIEKIPEYKSFYDTRGKYSIDENEYCEREWEFFTQEGGRKPDGRVMLLRRDKNGNPYFKVLYENDINQGGFRLTKTQLYDNLYDNYHLRNVLLVDFGCTNTRGVDKLGLLMIRKGYFGGGKRTYKKYNPKSKK